MGLARFLFSSCHVNLKLFLHQLADAADKKKGLYFPGMEASSSCLGLGMTITSFHDVKTIPSLKILSYKSIRKFRELSDKRVCCKYIIWNTLLPRAVARQSCKVETISLHKLPNCVEILCQSYLSMT